MGRFGIGPKISRPVWILTGVWQARHIRFSTKNQNPGHITYKKSKMRTGTERYNQESVLNFCEDNKRKKENKGEKKEFVDRFKEQTTHQAKKLHLSRTSTRQSSKGGPCSADGGEKGGWGGCSLQEAGSLGEASHLPLHLAIDAEGGVLGSTKKKKMRERRVGTGPLSLDPYQEQAMKRPSAKL